MEGRQPIQGTAPWPSSEGRAWPAAWNRAWALAKLGLAWTLASSTVPARRSPPSIGVSPKYRSPWTTVRCSLIPARGSMRW